MSMLRRATESQGVEWKPIPEGLWRFEVGKPVVTYYPAKGDWKEQWRVKFPVVLTEAERERLATEHGEAPDGTEQSWRSSYSCGLSLGWIDKQGQYQTTKLVDFLAACFGSQQSKKFREWIAGGGGPPTQDTGPEDEASIIDIWLGWVEGCELYGSIRHEPDKSGNGVVWARFGGPMAVGSLPGQKDDAYQALGLGKLRGMMTDQGGPAVQEAVQAAAMAKQEVIARTFQTGDLPV